MITYHGIKGRTQTKGGGGDTAHGVVDSHGSRRRSGWAGVVMKSAHLRGRMIQTGVMRMMMCWMVHLTISGINGIMRHGG